MVKDKGIENQRNAEVVVCQEIILFSMSWRFWPEPCERLNLNFFSLQHQEARSIQGPVGRDDIGSWRYSYRFDRLRRCCVCPQQAHHWNRSEGRKPRLAKKPWFSDENTKAHVTISSPEI